MSAERPTGRKRGRQTKLTRPLIGRVVKIIEGGNYREVAADALGVHPDTFGRWMALGLEEKSGIHAEFRRAVLEAEAKAERYCVKLVMVGAKEDPKHAEWFLERKFHKRWGRKAQIALTGEDGGPVSFVDALRAFGSDDSEAQVGPAER